MKKKILHTTIAFCTLALASLAQAQFFVGLNTGGTSITTFGGDGVSSAPIAITGLSGGDSIVDLDFRPSNGLLYGMGSSGTFYQISLAGVATVNAGPVYTPNMGETATSLGTPTVIDFNPAVDRLRVYSGTTNYRITPTSGVINEDGQLMYVVDPMNPDPQEGMTPNLVAAAYINADTDPGTMTVLYSIDAMFNTLVVNQVGPEFSTLRTQDILQLGGMGPAIDFLAGNTGFDVLTLSGMNTAYVSNGNTFFIVNLNMGMVGGVAGDLTNAFTVTGPGGTITDFTVIPEPSTYVLLGVGFVGLALLARRRSQARA